MKNFLHGIGDCLKAHRVVKQSKMTWVYVIPILFSIIMVSLIFKFTDDLVSSIALPLIDLFSLETPEAIPEALLEKITYGLRIAGEYAIYGVLYLMSYFIFFKIQKYIVLIAMSPVMAYVSEKAEEVLMGNTYEFKMGIFFKDIWRGIRIAMRNLFLELALIVLIGIVISGVSAVFTPLALIATPLSALLMFVVSAYYYGYSSFDYLNERKRMGIKQGNRLIWDNKGLVTGNGSFFGVLILIPFVGLILAPIWCPIGAVISSKKQGFYQ